MNIDLFDFLLKGIFIKGLGIGSTVNDVIDMIGNPGKIIGDKHAGFMYYEKGIRVGYFNETIDEFSIIFYNNPEVEFHLNSTTSSEIISGNTSIHSFISIINRANIKWKSNDEGNINVFSLVTNAQVYVLFDLETGLITKIAKSNE